MPKVRRRCSSLALRNTLERAHDVQSSPSMCSTNQAHNRFVVWPGSQSPMPKTGSPLKSPTGYPHENSQQWLRSRLAFSPVVSLNVVSFAFCSWPSQLRSLRPLPRHATSAAPRDGFAQTRRTRYCSNTTSVPLLRNAWHCFGKTRSFRRSAMYDDIDPWANRTAVWFVYPCATAASLG